MKHRFTDQGEGMKPSSSSTILSSFVALLLMVLISVNPLSAEQYESEFNDTRETATPITYGDLVVGNLWHAVDYDWYKVDIPTSGLVSLTVYYEFPDESEADPDALFVELRTEGNQILSDFYIDYEDEDPPYIRDVNIPSAGAYYVVLYCPNVGKYKRDRYYLSVSQGGGERATVKILNEESPVIVADGKSQAIISAQVLDKYDKPVVGAPVVFSIADSSATGTMTFSGSSGTSTENFAVAAGSIKEFSLTTNSYWTEVEIVNASTGESESLYSTLNAENGATFSKSFDSDGVYYLQINVSTVLNWNSEDSVVSWQLIMTNRNTGDSVVSSKEIDTIATGGDGIARLIYKSSENKGTYLILASFGNDAGQISLGQIAGEPTQINLVDLQGDTTNTDLYVDRNYILNTTLVDKFGNGIEDGIEVRLASDVDSATGTTLQIDEPTVETKNGRAEFIISAPRATEYTVTATVVDNTAISDTLTLSFDPINMNNMMARPAYILADGETETIISVRMSDENGLAVNGETVEFTTTCGTLLQNIAVSGVSDKDGDGNNDNDGIAQVALMSPYEPGTCVVTAAYGTRELTAPVVYYGDGSGSTAVSIQLETESKTVPANGTSTVVLTATLSDAAGEPVAAGVPVHFTTTHGMFLTGEQEFSGSMPVGGSVKVALLSVAEDIGKATITCTSGTVTQSIQVTFTALSPDGSPMGESTSFATLTAAPAAIPADGKSSLMITAELKNATDNPVPAGTEIAFYAAAGTFSNGLTQFTAATTDESGKVNVALLSSTTPGPVDVWCLSNGVYQLTTVTFTDTDPGATSIGYIALSATPATLPADGKSSTAITAILTDAVGAPVPAGVSIVFSTNIGKFSNGTRSITTATMDDTGRVTIPLISSTTAGFAQVTATSGGVTQNTLVTFEGEETPEGTANIALTANPTQIPADGASSLTVTAVLTDSTGSPVSAGTSVTFQTDGGTFQNRTTTHTVITSDDTGQVSVSLISSTTAGSVDVTCTSNGVSQRVTVQFVGDIPDNETANIALSADPIQVPADGESSLTLTAILTDSTGAPVVAGTPLTFRTEGGVFQNGTTEYTMMTSDASGRVVVSLISSTTAGSVNVICTSNGVTQRIIVQFIGDAPDNETANIALSADPMQIPAGGDSSLTITAVLTDSSGASVPAGTSLTLRTNNGVFQNGFAEYTLTTADDSGRVSVALISSIAAVSADITCTSNGVTQLITVLFTGPSTGVGETTTISLSASPATITADGDSSTTITITMTDSTGAPVNTGTQALLTTTLGTLSQTTVSTVDESGTISVGLTAGTEAGTARVVCTSNGITQSISVIFTGGPNSVQTPAQLALSLSQLSVKTDNSDSTIVTSTVVDSDFAVIEGIPVTFRADGGQLSNSLVETDVNGQAQVTFSSGTTNRSNATVNITATVAGLDPQVIPVQVVGSTLTLTDTGTDLILDDASTAEDESNSSTLTITARDAGDNPVYNTTVTVTSTGTTGSLEWEPAGSTFQTDINGQLSIEVAGTLAGNPQITVEGLGTTATKSYVVAQLADSFGIVLPESNLTNISTKDPTSLAITVPSNGISFNDNGAAADTIVRSDGGSFLTDGYENGDEIMVGGSNSNDGRYTIDAVTATTITLVGSDRLTAEGVGSEITLTNSVVVRVQAPNQDVVRFATTMGQLDGEGVQVKTVNVNNGYASVVVSSELAGVATVEVSDNDKPNTVDRVSIAFARPSVEAATVMLQTNTAAIAPSVGDNKSVAEFTAYVKTSGDTGNQAVAGVPVIFSIENATGSGEFVSPVIAYTDAAGEAKTTFTAGSLGSGAEGVTVTARVVGSAITDYQNSISFVAPRTIHRSVGSFLTDTFKVGQQIKVEGSANNDGYYTVDAVTDTDLTLDDGDIVVTEGEGAAVLITALTHSTNIVIGGTSGSVVIGRGAGDSIVILNPTTYSLYMSVLVSDLNGNPVSGADVSLNLWPIQYNTGVWFDLNDRVSDHYVPYTSGSFQNEDINENTFLDPGEDTNKDGILTPPNSASGNIPTLLTTDENGLAEFSIIYLKSSAVWIGARIRATTMVFGTETKASMEFTLPAEKTEAEAGYLPNSAYPYVLTCTSGGTATFFLRPFASEAYDTFTSSLADVTITGIAGGVDTDGDGNVDEFSSYSYTYTDPGLSSGTIRYDSVSVSDAACITDFPVKIIIE